MIIIHKGMIHIDNPLFQIDITPTKPGQFTDMQASSDHYSKQRIPVSIGFMVFHIIEEELLLRYRQSTTFLGFIRMSLYKLFKYTI